MAKLTTRQWHFETGGGEVLDRIIEAYGFTSKIDYCNHLNISGSSLSMRYKRNHFPSDLAIRCIAETGVNLEWLATGTGKKFDDGRLDVFKIPKKKLIDGQLFDASYLIFDKDLFLPSQLSMGEPQVILDGETHYIVDCIFSEVYDGKWLVNIEGKISIRDLTRIPIRRVRVSGVGMAFDCGLEDINVLGRVVMTCS
ncbi:TPA: phage repressor protein CI [Yersinia enterocolitica]|uniref:phage repressor protein CI n=1 Tax=Yersinia TaxID=629 RepID=UPI0005E68337|nr:MULTISPECIES: phage repressor protein CI [Yersinia]ELW9026517.1 phage repressor protein CI [Yersinia enterocolitica]CQJ26195.1 CI repressor [Yersinia mollaretii]HEN3568054.1 phage repressor protein CI [Yersinia enterocolitica]HEN3569402.1 phage repressor protein CI [Yersinia enterocolitica]HEN3575605.1 phage repressor protein CI [Yersinia enterocolitica]